jgi:amylosucrase
MDWEAAGRRTDPAGVEGRVHAGFRRLAAARLRTPELRGCAPTAPVWTENPKVLAWRRDHPRVGSLLGLANVDDHMQTVAAGVLDLVGLREPVDALDESRPLGVTDGHLALPRLAVRWLVEG